MSESHAANTGGHSTFNWCGYDFEEYSIDDQWREVGGLFLFVSINIPHRNSIERCVLYVEATPNFASSIPNHPMLPKARQLGATMQMRASQLGLGPIINVHARVVEPARLRSELEDHLLDGLRPRLNFE